MKAAQKLGHADFRRALQNNIGVELRMIYEDVVNQIPSPRLLDLFNRLDEGKKPDLGSGSELKEAPGGRPLGSHPGTGVGLGFGKNRQKKTIFWRRFQETLMLGTGNGTFDPETLVSLETAFDEAWITLKTTGSANIRPDELARRIFHLAMEGERDPVRLHDGALSDLIPAAKWREVS